MGRGVNGSDQVKMNLRNGRMGIGRRGDQVTTPSEKREDELGARVFERLTNQSRDHL